MKIRSITLQALNAQKNPISNLQESLILLSDETEENQN